MFQREISHEGLHKCYLVKGQFPEIVDVLAETQIRAWDERWERRKARKKERTDKFLSSIKQTGPSSCNLDIDIAKDLAADATREYEEAIDALEHLLRDSLEEDHSIDWGLLVDESRYGPKPSEPHSEPAARDPDISDEEFRLARRREWLAAIDRWKRSYLACDPKSIPDYCKLVLVGSKYPDSFPYDAAIDYVADSRTLVVDYSLPDISAMPTVKEVKVVAARSDLKEVHVSEAWLSRTYDLVLYQIALRSLYELFQGDAARAIDSIVFNGWVNSIDKATGREVNGCILSIHATKAEFMDINLANVDPKACFKKLKGVSAAKLTALQPVRPILQLSRDDRRFVQAHDVADGLDSSSNLAAMDWEDFEHLIRELFEEEFSAGGSEVKITQASRDGGVDAIVFDPDPIRGGKIVIQAKRYTNTVSVSAVRDLFGTVHNEGANKGVLVTTADYGPDAYEFAKGKPLTLISGGELLYLLAKHGHKARIDLKEARLLAAEHEKSSRLGGV
jgi:restriction system protein